MKIKQLNNFNKEIYIQDNFLRDKIAPFCRKAFCSFYKENRKKKMPINKAYESAVLKVEMMTREELLRWQ